MTFDQYSASPDSYLEICQFGELAQEFPPHFHDHYVTGILLQGAREIHVPPCSFTLHAPALLTLNPRQVHGCRPADSQCCVWMALNISREFMAKLFPCCENPLFSSLSWQDPSLVSEVVSVAQNLADSRLCVGRPEPAVERKVELQALPDAGDGELREILGTMLRPFLRFPALRSRQAIHSPAKLSSLRDWLETNSAEHVQLDRMANEFVMDKYDMLRKFAHLTGMPPHRYLAVLRLNRSQTMLRAGAAISDAAVMSGFCDQSHCARNYRKNLGFTPGVYLNAWRKTKPVNISDTDTGPNRAGSCKRREI